MNVNKLFRSLSIQDYITFGYLYLVILGIVNIVIYYSRFNINIFDFIGVSDILLAPINMLFLNYTFTILLLVFIGFLTLMLKFIFLGINELLSKLAIKYNKPKTEIPFFPPMVFVLLFTISFLFLSVNMTDGVYEKVKSKNFNMNTKLTFADNTTEEVYVIATTSMYMFYIEKGQEVVTIMPLNGNLKSRMPILKK